MRAHRTTHVLAALAVVAAAACDDPTGPEAGGPDAASARASVAFATAPSPATAPGAAAARVPVSGTNGTLELDEVYLVVTEFELKRESDDACPEDDDACEKFQAPPAFVEVPLGGGSTLAVTAPVDPGRYDEFELEVDDLDTDDDHEPAERRLFEEIRARFPEWPRDASLMVVGTFTPTDGAPRPFRVFFEAEVEVELDLSPPVVIGEGEEGTFTVELDPARWFVDGTGRVLDLSLLDFATTGRVAELEVEVEDGFIEVEFDDHD